MIKWSTWTRTRSRSSNMNGRRMQATATYFQEGMQGSTEEDAHLGRGRSGKTARLEAGGQRMSGGL